MSADLSDTMRAALHTARRYGGILTRHPGGFWSGPTFDRYGTNYGTSTITALVRRELLYYSEYKAGRGGRFPINAGLTVAGWDYVARG